MGVLKDSKFQLFAGIFLAVIVVTVVLAITILALKNTFETGETELAGHDMKEVILGTSEK